MYERAEEFWVGGYATVYVPFDEDMFLLKAVLDDGLGSGRRRDIEDMQLHAQRELEYESILKEIEKQRPLNSGPTEARHTHDRSHPLFAIETAVQTLPGLPVSFTECISEFATEFEAKYLVLEMIDDGRRETSSIRFLALSDVRSLLDGDERVVADVTTRLLDKQVIEHDGDTLCFKTTEPNSDTERLHDIDQINAAGQTEEEAIETSVAPVRSGGSGR